MADIRINELPTEASPAASDFVAIDGVSTRKTSIQDLSNAGIPVASQAEAEAGTNVSKRMTPLTTKQSITSEIGVSIASKTQGDKADTAVQPSISVSAGTGLSGGGDLSASRTISLSASSISALDKANTSVQSVNGVTPTAGNVNITAEEVRLKNTFSEFTAASFASNVFFVKTSGYYAQGDLGGALYRRLSSAPSPVKAWHNQSADGAWWELAENEPNIVMFGARSGSSTYAAANVSSINNAISYKSAMGGGRVLGVPGVFYLNAPITFSGIVNVCLDGINKSMTLKISAPFTGNEIVTLRGSGNSVEGSILDCSAITTASVWLSGIRAESANTVDCGVRGCEIKDASFCGIWLNDGTGSYTHTRFFAEDNIISNVGWMAISFTGTVKGRIIHNDVSRTGFSAIWADERNVGLRIEDNDVTKATAPYRVYNGPGSVGGVEKGFMIGYAPSNIDTLIADNRCVDNRNAAEDGIGLGEDGTEHGPCIIRNNFVRFAGLFGIDVASRATVQGNRIEDPATSGIFMSLDLGGSISQSIVKSNTIRSCNGPYAIQISSNMGNPLTIADCEISDNIIVDYRGTPSTQYGLRINKTNLTIINLKVNNNIAVNIGGTIGFLYDGTGADAPIFISGNQWKNTRMAVTGNFSATGYESFQLSNASATNFAQMTGGYEGKEVYVYFNDGNTTLKPDWLDTLGFGANRLIGLGNVARVMAAGDGAKFRYRSGLGWQIISIVDSY